LLQPPIRTKRLLGRARIPQHAAQTNQRACTHSGISRLRQAPVFHHRPRRVLSLEFERLCRREGRVGEPSWPVILRRIHARLLRLEKHRRAIRHIQTRHRQPTPAPLGELFLDRSQAALHRQNRAPRGVLQTLAAVLPLHLPVLLQDAQSQPSQRPDGNQRRGS